MITKNKTSQLLAVLFAVMFLTAGTVQAGKPKIAGGCKRCHTAEENGIRGKLGPVSEELKTLQVKVGTLVWVIKYDDKTTVVKGDKTSGADDIANIPKGKEILVIYSGDEPKLLASEIAVKQPYKVPEKQKITNAEVVELIAQGPEKDKYTLIDARPLGVYLDGHIPTAKALPFGAFEKMHAKVLPEAKDRLLIFYCGGPTWTLSPFSAREAEKLGYTNVKVLSTGLPGWKNGPNNFIISEANGLKKKIYEENPYVLVDLRPKEAASAGHIKGAVSIPESELALYKDKFPKKKSAPVILYDEGMASKEAFSLVRGWGYKNASVLNGGAQAWTGNFFPGDPGTDIVYVKKLKPGQISIEEFSKLAKELPDDKVFLDVCESREFILTGAMAIPRPELADRLDELPKDKEILLHCYTGINASMAYKILTENGFKARYLDAVVLIRPDGTCECSEK